MFVKSVKMHIQPVHDTFSNEPLCLKDTLLKWHFVDWAHFQKMVSLNSFDKTIS